MLRCRPVVLSLAVATVGITAACSASAIEVPLPPGLIGRWTTNNPDYADRYFDLSANAIVIGTGGRTRESYRISRILEERDDNGRLYTVEYRDTAGEEYAMRFYFDGGRGGTVRLKNQPRMTWRKVPR